MLLRPRPGRESGVTLVECAVVYPLTLFIIFTLIIGAMGVFRYQEMAHLAREAARYASTHGAQYRKDAGLAVGTGGSTASSPLDTSTSPYNASPWTTIRWYATHPTEAAGTYPNQWADVIYDATARNQLFMMTTTDIRMYVGWTPVPNQSDKPDNYPGSRITVVVQYPVFPEWFGNTGRLSVSTAPMPITN